MTKRTASISIEAARHDIVQRWFSRKTRTCADAHAFIDILVMCILACFLLLWSAAHLAYPRQNAFAVWEKPCVMCIGNTKDKCLTNKHTALGHVYSSMCTKRHRAVIPRAMPRHHHCWFLWNDFDTRSSPAPRLNAERRRSTGRFSYAVELSWYFK